MQVQNYLRLIAMTISAPIHFFSFIKIPPQGGKLNYVPEFLTDLGFQRDNYYLVRTQDTSPQ